MGLDKANLPDTVLRLVSPADRKAAGLPPPMADIVKAKVAKSDLKRERDLQIQVVSWLRLRGHTVMWSAMHRKLTCTFGWPDITFAVCGRAVALECKLPGEQPTEDQKRVMAGLAKDGWAVKIVHSLDEARAFIESVK